MRIPLGNFGNRLPDPVQHGAVSYEGMDATARATEHLGNVGVGLAQNYMEKQQQDTDALNRAKAGYAVLEREDKVKIITEDFQKRIEDGSLTHDQVEPAFSQALTQLDNPDLANLDPVTALNYSKGIKRVDISGMDSARRLAEHANTVESKNTTDQVLDIVGKKAGALGADVGAINTQIDSLDQVGTIAYGANWSKVKQNAKDNNWTNQAIQSSLANRENLDGLKKLETDLTAKDGFYADKLDPDRRNSVLRQVMNDRSQLENKIQHLSDKRDTTAERALNEIDRQTASGIPATAQMWEHWNGLIKGSTFEGELKDRMNDEQKVQDTLRLPIEKQLTFVQEKEANLLQNGGNSKDAANLNRLKSAVQNNVKQLQETPLLFNQARTGVPVEPLDFTAVATPEGSAKISAQLADRVDSIKATQKQYGDQVKMAPLLPQEAKQLTASLNSASPKDQVALFGTLHRSIKDPEAYSAVMQQIAPDSPVKSLAGMLATKGSPLTLNTHWFKNKDMVSGEKAAETMLAGENILNKTKEQKASDGKAQNFPLPPQKDFETQLSSEMGTVFANRPEVYQMAAQAVRAYYTGKAAQDGDVSGALNPERLREAIKASLGEVVAFNDHEKIILPWGMDESTFSDRYHAEVQKAVQEKRAPESAMQLEQYGLQNAGQGTYYMMVGKNYKLDDKGNRILLNIEGAAK